jgi:predicted acyl esterase
MIAMKTQAADQNIRKDSIMKNSVLSFVILWFFPFAAAAQEKAPSYQVRIERDVRVRMRDGVTLSADLYVPLKDGQPLQEKLPAVLQRTPYDKLALEKMASFFAGHGYLSVVQDCRGRFASEGNFFAFINEPHDGYDTIE